MNLSNIQKEKVKIVDEASNNISDFKSLFSNNWTDEDIAQAMKIAQDNIETTLAAYNLPLYSYENR
jgi:hypothetical protein